MSKFYYLLLCLFSFGVFSQQNLLPISSFYKDQLLAPRSNSYANKPAFFPISEGVYNLHQIIRDSSKQYYEFTERLFKKHFIELKGEGYQLNISPVLNIALGRDFADSSSRRLFDNTRGFLVEVDLLDKFSLSTAVYENQNRFTRYESEYYLSVGERYPNVDSGYNVQNGVVPGAARTKPFKVDGLDYAYALGNVVFAPKKQLRFALGNQANFVGLGYRSLFLSDNSVPAVHIRMDATFAKKLDYTFLRSKQLNLLRRPFYTTVESNYETKLFSSQFLSYRIGENWNIAIFEGSYWSKGDSVSSKPVNGAYYIPVPFVGGWLTSKKEVSTLSGLQFTGSVYPSLRVYGQLALTDWNAKSVGSQIGMRYYNIFGLQESMFQLEYNNVPKSLFIAENSRLNYSSYNLPTAHPKGNGFQEFVFRMNYTKKRIYMEWKSVLYLLKNYQATNLIASNFGLESLSGTVYHQQIELGYRFNKKINLELFVKHIYRTASAAGETTTNAVFGGIRTGLINHYNDF